MDNVTWRIFHEIDEKCWHQQRITWKVVTRLTFEKSNIIAFQWGVIHPNRSSGSEIWAIQMFGTKKMTSATNFRHFLQTSQGRKFCEIARECVKLNSMKWKVWRMSNELLTKNLTGWFLHLSAFHLFDSWCIFS